LSFGSGYEITSLSKLQKRILALVGVPESVYAFAAPNSKFTARANGMVPHNCNRRKLVFELYAWTMK
jgi:hypothetical protein